jgi:hypothetical protein
MEIANLPVQQEKINLWKALNAGKMKRPMVAIEQLPWHELNVNDELTLLTENNFWRGIELYLRKQLYMWRHFPTDMVIEPCVPIPMAISGISYGVGIQEDLLATDENNDVVSHYYKNQFETDEDLNKIKNMRISHDEEETARRMETARELFAGIIDVRPQGHLFHLGLWDFISQSMGIGELYYGLADRPEYMHAIMRRLTDSAISGIKQANELGLHDSQANVCHCSYIYTNELLPAPGEGKAPLSQNSWAYGLAQPFTSVSPATTKEFEVPYISEICKFFGGIYYGCCDRLDDRLDIVKEIPNVRKISCSPWSDINVFAEKIGPVLTMSVKPNPAMLAGTAIDYGLIEKDLRRTAEAARRNNVNLEIILKDISTINYEPARLIKWNEIVMNIVNE